MATGTPSELRTWTKRSYLSIALLLTSFVPTARAEQATDENDNRKNDTAADPAETLLPGHAALKTDAEYQRLLKRAADSIAEGRPDLAAVLWQKVIDEPGDALVAEEVVRPIGPSSTPLIVYRPVRQHVEEQMQRLPPAALAAYRTSADAEARAILATASDRDEQALREVVRRFFCSSMGEAAAFKLACLALDRHDFVVASRLLTRLLHHPDLSIPKAELWARLAVASAHLQDKSRSRDALKQLDAADISADRKAFVELIRHEVTRVNASPSTGSVAKSANWLMPFGDATRTAHMSPVSPANVNGPLTELRVHEFAIPPGEPSTLQPQDGYRGDQPQTAVMSAAARDALVRQWRDAGWRPAGRLLFDGSHVYLKSADRLLCFATEYSNQPVWQSAWENRYDLDPLSRQMTMLPSVPGQRTQPSAGPDTRQTIWTFGDRVHQSMSIVDGVIYSLEGRRNTAGRAAQTDRNFAFGSTPRRSRGNWLTAYHASGGKAIWTRPAAEEEKIGPVDVGFLAAPTPCDSLLLAPMTDGGTMWLLALDKATGKTIWKTFLCDEPPGGAAPWAEIVISVSGSEVYLTCGCGVVFAIDGNDGQMQWAVRYERSVHKADARSTDGDSNGWRIPRGWDDDVTICQGRLLLLMSSDSDQLLAVDRRTGQRLWESPRVPPLSSAASYCLGIHRGELLVAGKNVVRKYDVESGRLMAEQRFDNSLGRGCLTTEELFIPVNEHILRFDLNLAGSEKISVALMRREPIGNLFSINQRLWVVGAGRVYSLTALKERLELLEARIAAGDLQARLERARLHQREGRMDLMVEDLRTVYCEQAATGSASEAAGTICDVVAEQRLAQDEPISALRLLTDVSSMAATVFSAGSPALQRRREQVGIAISNIRQQRPSGSVETLLKAAAICDEDYLLTAAALTLEAVATLGDVPAIVQALDNGNAAIRLVSIRAATKLAPDQVKRKLARSLSDRNDRVRLAAARALAGLNERTGVLEALIALLESPDTMVRARAQQTLQSLTGQGIPFAAEGASDDRATSVRAWRQWISTNGASVKLALPLVDRTSRLGRALIASPSVLVELDNDHKERSRQPLPGAAWGCQGLPNGNRLVAINSHSMIIEYDEAGKETWRKDRLPAPPTTIQRLDSGSTLTACPSTHQVVEISTDGSTSAISVPGWPISAQRLDNGNTLVALQEAHRVAEITGSGRTVWEVQTNGPPAHAVRLENGNTLVTLPQARKVVEYDTTGNTIVWMTNVPLVNPAAAQRLSNGNTLVADHTGVMETDGKQIVWRYQQPQATGLSAF